MCCGAWGERPRLTEGKDCRSNSRNPTSHDSPPPKTHQTSYCLVRLCLLQLVQKITEQPLLIVSYSQPVASHPSLGLAFQITEELLLHLLCQSRSKRLAHHKRAPCATIRGPARSIRQSIARCFVFDSESPSNGTRKDETAVVRWHKAQSPPQAAAQEVERRGRLNLLPAHEQRPRHTHNHRGPPSH